MAARSPSAGSRKKKKKRKAKATASNLTKKSKKRSDEIDADGGNNAAADDGSNEVDTSRSTDDTTDTTAIESVVSNDSVSRRTFLDFFWTLASTDQSDRVGAANGIVSFLVAEQAKPKTEDDVPASAVEEDNVPASAVAFGSCHESLRYALKRLVKGLQSSRAGARQGFSLALVGILQHPAFSELVSIGEVLSFGDTVLDYAVMKKRHEARECMFGKVFLYMAVHRSKRLTNPEDVMRVTENLVVLAHKKPFLREICLETVGEIATAASVTLCRDTILPIVVRDVAGFRNLGKDVDPADDVDPLSPEELALAFALRSRFGALKQHKDSPSYAVLQTLFRLTDNNSIDSWLEPLKASSGVFPRVHTVWTHMLKTEKKTKKSKKSPAKSAHNTPLERCLSVWHTVVEPHFFRGTSHERKYLGFQLMHRFLESLQQQQHHGQCAQLLTPNLLSCVYNNVMDDSALLHDAAVKAVRALLTQPPLVRVTAAVSLMACARRSRIKANSDDGKDLIQQLLSYTKEVYDTHHHSHNIYVCIGDHHRHTIYVQRPGRPSLFY